MLCRIQARQGLDDSAIAKSLAAGNTVVVQFGLPDDCPEEQLGDVERLCARHDGRLEVRLYASAPVEFDARLLRRIPSVRSLGLECLNIVNAREIGTLAALQRLRFGAEQHDAADLLAAPNLSRLTHLTIGKSKAFLDLAPLRRMSWLSELALGGFANEVAIAREVSTLKALWLTRVPSSVDLAFVRELPNLRHLSVQFGSRDSLDEVRSHSIRSIQILRARGLTSVPTRHLPNLAAIAVDDQPHLERLDFRANGVLERVRVSNCRTLRSLLGLHDRAHLKEVRIHRTAVDFEALLAEGLPASLEVAAFGTGKRTTDRELRARLDARGLAEVSNHCLHME